MGYVAKSKRAKKLQAIMTKIAVYAVSETYARDEEDAQQMLAEAIGKIEKAQECIDRIGDE